MPNLLSLPLVLAAALVALPAHAQKDIAPKPETYLCPNAAGTAAVDCFLNAVEHLYTMCRQVKSIEIIEFGYERSDEGTNGAKTEYCIEKHKQSMSRPYQAALKEAKASRPALDGMRGLHEVWVGSLVDLKWKAGETDAQYKERIGQPYVVFREREVIIRTALLPPEPKAKAAATAKAPAAGAAKPKADAAQPKAEAATKSTPAATAVAPKSTN